MEKLLIVCGPTATGKTALAVHLSKVLGGEIISADSRQVYKYMDIGTGKDNPEGVEIKGYDLALPDHEFNVSEYIKLANKFINETLSKNKLPILVGGTGFYIKGVIDGIDTSSIPKNELLREKLSKLSVEELQKKLKAVNIKKFNSLNDSDAKNPRRLVRAIEVAEFDKAHKPLKQTFSKKYNVLFIGLFLPSENLEVRIKNRVEKRIKQGFEKELEFLKKKGYHQAISKTIGYKDWPDIEKWKKEEIKYAKRQMTWFKRDARINWFDVSRKGYIEKIEKLVEKWYATN